MFDDQFVPTLRPTARLLFIDERAAPGFAAALQRGAAPLKRIAEIAESLGHQISEIDAPLAVEIAPEAIIFDGSARGALEMLRAIRAEPSLGHAPILAVCGRCNDETLEELRSQGVDDFLGAEAPKAEIQTRVESAAALSQARDEVLNLKAQLARQTRVDDLTGVMSRRFFFQQGHRETGRARRYGHKLSCLMLEIDHFRALCSTYGDAAGEAMLRSLATIIGQWTRDSDYIARFADAKFAVLLPETSVEGATSAREKILTALGAHKWNWEEQLLPISVSIGESELQPVEPKHRKNDGEFIDEGDEAGETALSTREALAGLLEDADAALAVSRKGARVPDVFVPHTAAPDVPSHSR